MYYIPPCEFNKFFLLRELTYKPFFIVDSIERLQPFFNFIMSICLKRAVLLDYLYAVEDYAVG